MFRSIINKTLFLVLLGCITATSSQAKELEKLDLTYVTSNAIYWDLDVGIDKGFFKDEGFNARAVTNSSSVQSVQTLIAGDVQMAISQPGPLIQAVSKGATQIGLIATPADQADWFLVGKKGVTNLKELKGQRVGFSGLSVSEFYLTRDLLAKHGIGPHDFTPIQVGPTPAKFAALQNGSIGAGVLFQPTATQAQLDGFPVLFRYAPEFKDFPSIGYLVNRKWASTNDHGQRFVRAIKRIHAWLYNPANRDEAIKVLQKYTHRDTQAISAVYDLYFVSDKLYGRTGEVNVANMKATVKRYAKNAGMATGSVPTPEQYLIPAADGGPKLGN
ncbi:MAG: ABC transporter substrate-binding protein [Burkholderiaceae bacterium]|nr:MAG: ABC transporter substrate-binding protein [Burkholderiaceae bacterium]